MELCNVDLGYLVNKYSKKIPRYTSYPTADRFSNFTKDDWKNLFLKEDIVSKPATAIYVHVPFCKSLCYFCACSKQITNNYSLVYSYLQALKDEVRLYEISDVMVPEKCEIQQFHWGGGSPNFLETNEMESVFSIIVKAFSNFNSDAEISIELDPRGTSFEQLIAIRSLGFNRLSFGVQDFDPDVQKIINRQQSFDLTAKLIEKARGLSFSSISLDLIYGLPGQNFNSWEETISKVVQLFPDRISLFGYAHVLQKNKAQNVFQRYGIPTAEKRLSLFLQARDMLCNAGYVHIGLDHFAQEKDTLVEAKKLMCLSRNFMGYTSRNNIRTIGFGPSSISSLFHGFSQNVYSLKEYVELLLNKIMPVSRGMFINDNDRLRASIIQNIMCNLRVDTQIYQQTKTKLSDLTKHHLLIELEEDGLIEIESDYRFKVTERGQPFLRAIASIFDDYLYNPLCVENSLEKFSVGI